MLSKLKLVTAEDMARAVGGLSNFDAANPGRWQDDADLANVILKALDANEGKLAFNQIEDVAALFNGSDGYSPEEVEEQILTVLDSLEQLGRTVPVSDGIAVAKVGPDSDEIVVTEAGAAAIVTEALKKARKA